jgi:DNA polymerase-1
LDPNDLDVWPISEKSGCLSTKRDTLERFANVPLVRPLLQHRWVDHRLTTWGHVYQRHLQPDGRLHPGFLLLGAGHTGRMSCRKPNTQNLPRAPALRACFVAPEGYRILAADFSQIELRIPALLSGDPTLRNAYAEGRDLHRLIVSETTGIPEDRVTNEDRKKGKAINFLFLYGGGVDTYRTRAFVSYGLEISEVEGQRHRDVFDVTYAGLRWWQSDEYSEHKRLGGVRTVGRRWLPFPDPQDCYTNSRNYPIQGSAADLQYLAIQRVHQALQGMDAHLVNFIHDELVLEVREDLVDEVSALVQDEMTGAFLDLFKGFDPAPLARGLVEVGVGRSYAEAK